MAASYFLVIDGLLPIDAGGDANFEPCTNLARLLLFLSASPDDESNAEVDRFLLLPARSVGQVLALHFHAGVQVPRLVLRRGVRSATK